MRDICLAGRAQQQPSLCQGQLYRKENLQVPASELPVISQAALRSFKQMPTCHSGLFATKQTQETSASKQVH